MSKTLTDIKERLTGLFSSLRLAIVLIIILAAVSIIGTVLPQEREMAFYVQRYGEGTYNFLRSLGVIDLYHSWGFRVLTCLLSVNLLVCSVRRLKGIYRRTVSPVVEKSEESIKSLRISNDLPNPEKSYVLEGVLAEKKYRITKRGRSLYAYKGLLGIWGDMITHMSILLVLMGALAGSLGFVGTVNVYVGDWTEQFYNWNTSRDEPLGFGLYVENFTLKFYPVDLKINVRGKTSGEDVGDYETREGASFSIPGTGYTISPSGFDIDRQEVSLKVYDRGTLAGVYNTGEPDGGPQAPPLLPFDFRLSAFRDPMVKNVSSTVRIIKDGRVVKRGEVEVNSPLEFGGVTIYQAAYDRDPEGGRYYSGFQIVRDPGLPLVWAGFAMLLAGLFLSFYFYHRQVWVYVGDDKVVVGGSTNKDWPGFMREYGGMIKRFVQEAEP